MNVVIEALERGPAIVVPMVREAPAEILKRRPAARKWSIHEHACHVAEVDTLMSSRLDVMLAEDEPVIRSYDPGRDDPDGRLLAIELDAALDRYAHDRFRLI